MPGGVICWDIKDQCVGGSFTCTKYKHVLFFREQLKFNLHETLYVKSTGISHHKGRYPEQIREVFVFSKGRPRAIHRIEDRLNVTAGAKSKLFRRSKSGEKRVWNSSDSLVPILGFRSHLWEYQTGHGQTTKDHLENFPAPMAEKLAADLIRSYSNEGDLVLDPFSGSGTTAKMALLNFRDYLGFEVWEKAFELSERRLAKAHRECQKQIDLMLFGDVQILNMMEVQS
jgi:site-specific DNA-methyltransferase (adenine-specific)